MEIYKIKNTKTGLYSLGGGYPKFNKNGKIWKRRSDLSNHLNLIDIDQDYKDCIIEVLYVAEIPIDKLSIEEYYSPIIQRREQREQEYKIRMQQYKIEQEKKALAGLLSKYGQP